MANFFTFLELIKTNHSNYNVPSLMEHVENLCTLADFLNEVREEFGEPIVVNSAYRTPIVNKLVGGVSNSYHLEGRAADIRPSYTPSVDFYSELERLNRILVRYYGNEEIKEFIPHQNYTHIAI